MKPRHLLLGTYFAICAACLIWPIYPLLGNHVEPTVLTLPLSFAYNLGWVVLTFAVVLVYHLATGEEG